MMTYKKIHKTKNQWREEDSTGRKMNRERKKNYEVQRQEKYLGGTIEKRRTVEEEDCITRCTVSFSCPGTSGAS